MNDKKVTMPQRLTAENGAKHLLLGEFFETVWIDCPECYGDGCEECNGEGGENIKVYVSWSTIKDIYKTAVAHFGEHINPVFEGEHYEN